MRRADGTEKWERFFPHSLESGGPLDVWEGICTVDNVYVFLEYEQVMVVRANTSYATRCHRDVDGGKDSFSEACPPI